MTELQGDVTCYNSYLLTLGTLHSQFHTYQQMPLARSLHQKNLGQMWTSLGECGKDHWQLLIESALHSCWFCGIYQGLSCNGLLSTASVRHPVNLMIQIDPWPVTSAGT